MTEYHDEGTIRRVHDALRAVGLDYRQAMDAINEMQNAGILFRDREPGGRIKAADGTYETVELA